MLRTDLRLRTDYPHLRTEIYGIPPAAHAIFVPKDQLNLQTCGRRFADGYVRMGQELHIVNERPSTGTRLAGIEDSEIGAGIEGLVLTEAEIETILAGRFPRLPLLNALASDRGGAMRFSFAAAVDPELEADLRTFLLPLFRGRPVAIDVGEGASVEPDAPVSDVTAAGQASRFRPVHKRTGIPTFVREDEEWWFASLPALFRGDLHQELLSFVRDAGTACYLQLDAPSQIDLRQALLAYDMIYMEPPAVKADGCTGLSTVTRAEFLELVAADRVRFLHRRPVPAFWRRHAKPTLGE